MYLQFLRGIQECNLNTCSALTGFVCLKSFDPSYFQILHKMPWKRNISYNNWLTMDLQPCLYSSPKKGSIKRCI